MDKIPTEILACPKNKRPLEDAPEELLKILNKEIEQSRLNNIAGEPVNQPFSAGYIESVDKIFYPIIDDIPVLIYELAIRY